MKILLIVLGIFFSFLSGSNNANNTVSRVEYTANSVQIRSEVDDFLTYWREDFRKDNEGKLIAICDITKEQFNDMYYNHYTVLTSEDRAAVNATADYESGYTIKNSIDQLASMFNKSKSNINTKSNLDQPTSIIIVVSISIFGFSTISIFFIFKQKKFIQ